jgi:hypothetical protein
VVSLSYFLFIFIVLFFPFMRASVRARSDSLMDGGGGADGGSGKHHSLGLGIGLGIGGSSVTGSGSGALTQRGPRAGADHVRARARLCLSVHAVGMVSDSFCLRCIACFDLLLEQMSVCVCLS